jgi:hypothetical protein
LIEGIDFVLNDWLKVDEESSKATVPVVNFEPIFSFGGLVNFFIQLIESNDV